MTVLNLVHFCTLPNAFCPKLMRESELNNPPAFPAFKPFVSPCRFLAFVCGCIAGRLGYSKLDRTADGAFGARFRSSSDFNSYPNHLGHAMETAKVVMPTLLDHGGRHRKCSRVPDRVQPEPQASPLAPKSIRGLKKSQALITIHKVCGERCSLRRRFGQSVRSMTQALVCQLSPIRIDQGHSSNEAKTYTFYILLLWLWTTLFCCKSM
ncbi:hypothetical protein HDK90DRAFT_184449 [Phyllosticta capitalensis]|uniref:Uncharacterized protein n=1 Tax=Phyllosticta capitalensis TaxID=121624 RepID=A0ABR1YW90_9PEZI